MEKFLEFFKEIVFPYLKQVKASLSYPKQQMSLIVKDAFKEQDNGVILDLCKKKFLSGCNCSM